MGADHTGLCGIKVSPRGARKCATSSASMCNGALHLTQCCLWSPRPSASFLCAWAFAFLAWNILSHCWYLPSFGPPLKLSPGVIFYGGTSQISWWGPIFAPILNFPWCPSEYLACFHNFSFVCHTERIRVT